MAAIFVPPSGHACIIERYTSQPLRALGIEVAAVPEAADVIVAALAEELGPYVHRFDAAKRYLIWCDEPLWSCSFQLLDKAQLKVANPTSPEPALNIPVDVMNCFTGDVYFSNHHFFTPGYHIDLAELQRVDEREPFSDSLPAAARQIACFVTYRNAARWNFTHPCGIRGLNNLRTRVALEGKVLGKVDIFGQGWPAGFASGEDRFGNAGSDPFRLKMERYRNYHFALCFENTWAPYYVTEKIWQAILSGCLPIYYAGPQHSIYQEFPRNSFLDYHDYADPVELFEHIDRMTAAEHRERMAACLETLRNALLRSDEGRTAVDLQLRAFAARVHNIARNRG